MKSLFIFGGQNFADMAYHLFSTDSEYKVIGFTIDAEYINETQHLGLPVIPYEDLLRQHPPGSIDIFVAIGIRQLNQAREDKVRQVQQDGYQLASFLSSRSYPAANFKLGSNTMIMENVLLHPFIEIGSNTIIWSHSRIALKTRVEDNCWITSAVVGESCLIRNNTFIGLDVTISPGLEVGAYNIIGAGALITRNTKDYEVYKGSRAIRSKLSSKDLQHHSLFD